MASTKEIKRRIKSVKNTKKITKAMELVAASKMKKAVASAVSSRLYAEYSWEILNSIAKNTEKIRHPLFSEREKERDEKLNVLLILITSNRGLCGAYNAQVIKRVLSFLKKDYKDAKVDVVTIGKKGDAMMRRAGGNILASFFELPDHAVLRDILPVSELAVREFMSGNYDKVLVAYTDYVSALSQKPNIRQVIPVSKTIFKELTENLGDNVKDSAEASFSANGTDYLFEGDEDALVDSLARKIVRMQVFQMILESHASEQSARMIAMKNASDAAGEMIEDLTLIFNKARQSNITREISEISAGMAAVE